MVPVVVSQDWDGIRERPPSLSSAGGRAGCAPHLEACASCISSCRRTSSEGCSDCLSCSRRLQHQGWRVWSLFALNSFLIVLVVINFGITLWLMTIMKFHHNGMGQLKILSNGIQLHGKAYIMDSLLATSIGARDGQPLILQTYDNFTIVTVEPGGTMENRLFIDKDKFLSRSSNLIIEDDSGRLLFSSSPDMVSVGADKMRIVGTGGAIFDHSVQTPMVSSDSGQDLRLESLTRSLKIEGRNGITLESEAGGIRGSALKNIKFKSKEGAIKLESQNIVLMNLRTAQSAYYTSRSRHKTKIYQVCVFENGKLFLANPSGVCEMYDPLTV